MKKLILAPAVALAFTGLVAAPVAAAEAPSSSTQSDSAAAKAEQLKKDKAEKLAKEEAAQKKSDEKKAAADKAAKEKAAKEKADQEKQDAADKKAAEEEDAAKKAADKKKAEDKADKKSGDDAKDSKKPAPKDDDSDAKDDVEEINAQLKVATSSISAEDLATKGVKVTVTGLEKGDKLSTSGLSAPVTTASGSTETLNVKYSGDAEDLTEGSKALTVKVQRAGVSTESLQTQVKFQPFADNEIDASLKVDPNEITAEDLANKEKGVTVTVSGVKEGDKIKDSLTGDTETADADGNYTLHLWYEGDTDNLEEGKLPFTVTIDREGAESGTLNGTINVVDEVSEIDPNVSLSTKEISVEDFKKDGLKFTGEGFTPGGTVSVMGEAVSTQRAAAQADQVTADENGNVSGVVTAPASIEAGKYSLTFIDDKTGEKSDPVEVTVTADDAVDPIDASLKVDPKEITAEDLSNKDKGVTVTVSGVKKGDKIKDSLTGDAETADADGDYKLHLWYEGNPDSLEVGKVPFTVTINREGTESETLNGNINVVAEDEEDGDDGDNAGDTPAAPAEASFTVSPKTLEAADFANDKKGVTLAVEDCEPGADVHFAVTPKGIQVTAYENTVKADDEGKASVSVFGTSDNVSAYVGSYTASATCGDDSMKESFTVTAGADGGGSDDGNTGGNDGSQLPRTGADLGGLASGAILLLVGGAAVVMTGRRKKVGQSPSDF